MAGISMQGKIGLLGGKRDSHEQSGNCGGKRETFGGNMQERIIKKENTIESKRNTNDNK